jgi:hypothetical protein
VWPSAGLPRFASQHDVVEDAQTFAELHALERSTEPASCALGRWGPRDISAMQLHRALVTTIEAAARVECGRLPGTVWSDQPCDSLWRCVETDIAHSMQAAEANVEISHTEARSTVDGSLNRDMNGRGARHLVSAADAIEQPAQCGRDCRMAALRRDQDRRYAEDCGEPVRGV